MPDYKMSDPAYWQDPPQFEALFRIVTESIPNARGTTFPLGDPEDENTPIACVIKADPGYVVLPHAHVTPRFEIVVQGSIHVGDTVLHPGDVMTTNAREVYGPLVAGPDGFTTVEVFSSMDGINKRLIPGPDGELVENNLFEHPEVIVKLGEEEKAAVEAAAGTA